MYQDAAAELSGYDDPAFDDDGREVRKRRAYPAGSKRPNRAKPGATSVSFRLADDCLEYLRFLVSNGNAGSLTHAVEMCVRGDRAAQRKRA